MRVVTSSITRSRAKPTDSYPRAFGLTLIECAISIVIVATIILMAINAFGGVARGRTVVMSQLTGSTLANQLISEVLQNPYYEPGGADAWRLENGESNASRAAFDDIDDYDGWSETPPNDKAGTPLPGLAGWSRSVAVEHLDPDTLASCGATDTGLERITVTVTDPRGAQTTLTALRSNHGVFDARPAQPTTVVRWVGVQLQTGGDPSGRVYSGASIPNIVN